MKHISLFLTAFTALLLSFNTLADDPPQLDKTEVIYHETITETSPVLEPLDVGDTLVVTTTLTDDPSTMNKMVTSAKKMAAQTHAWWEEFTEKWGTLDGQTTPPDPLETPTPSLQEG